MSPEKMIPAISPAPAGETGGGFQNTVAELQFPGASHPEIAPLPRNSLAFPATGGASAVSTSLRTGVAAQGGWGQGIFPPRMSPEK